MSGQRVNDNSPLQWHPLSPADVIGSTVNAPGLVRGQQTTDERFIDLPQRPKTGRGSSNDRVAVVEVTSQSSNFAPVPPLALGNYGPHQGMFIGEVHDQRDTMDAFNKALPNLAGKVDVVFLEYYPQGTSPHGKSVEHIEEDLKSFNKTFGKGSLIAQDVHQMCYLASKHGIEIRGIEVPTPEGSGKGPKYLMWRLSTECNQAFLDNANHYAKEKGRESISFCMYGGLVHWVKLKKLAPAITGYRMTKGQLAHV